MIEFLLNMSCEFLDGNGTLQCHLTRALPVAKDNLGFNGEIKIAELRGMLCEQPCERPVREKDCPPFKDILALGPKSQFAKPRMDNRPLR